MSIGNIADMMGDHDRAMHAYEAALRHNPYSIPAMSAIANILRQKEQFARAVEYYQSILTFSQESGETWGALGHCYLMMDDLQKAYSAYQQALYHLRDPKEPKLWYGIGILYDRYGSLEYAEEAFTQVMEMDPKFEKANEIYFRLGIIYKQQMKHDLSLQCFKYILHNPPRPLTEIDIWFQIGHVYEQRKDYKSAKEAYERVLLDDPNHAKVLQQLGWLYHQQNSSFANQDLAITYLTKSLEADGQDAQSWYLLGRCYMAQQKYNKAYEAYQQAVYREGRNPTFWCSIGVLYYQINQYRDALDAYSRAIRLNPYISEVWYDLGTLYESCNNQLSDALDAYQRAAELDPTNTHIQARLEQLRNPQAQQANGAQQPAQPPAPRPHDPQVYQTAPSGPPTPRWNGPMNGQAAPPQQGPPAPAGPARPSIAPPNPLAHQGPLGQQAPPPQLQQQQQQQLQQAPPPMSQPHQLPLMPQYQHPSQSALQQLPPPPSQAQQPMPQYQPPPLHSTYRPMDVQQPQHAHQHDQLPQIQRQPSPSSIQQGSSAKRHREWEDEHNGENKKQALEDKRLESVPPVSATIQQPQQEQKIPGVSSLYENAPREGAAPLHGLSGTERSTMDGYGDGPKTELSKSNTPQPVSNAPAPSPLPSISTNVPSLTSTAPSAAAPSDSPAPLKSSWLSSVTGPSDVPERKPSPASAAPAAASPAPQTGVSTEEKKESPVPAVSTAARSTPPAPATAVAPAPAPAQAAPVPATTPAPVPGPAETPKPVAEEGPQRKVEEDENYDDEEEEESEEKKPVVPMEDKAGNEDMKDDESK
ncbi:hypothetical protein LIPSTDRAFT_81159 [Lipomyces starkeyi NRRL Y-11557]|uniref:Uncharacterized protein n=1 Tax=Lipomyces starkeyi NRRL Y-11557 TaxID=675824 RepID=A0A1E3QA46_LIPST|nr:hypothetical protein LIPSTDRAFT_81159 [Lipomyces starkeyi NRRL Y-11557]